MYHISLAQGQTQFFAGKNADPFGGDASFSMDAINGLAQLSAPVSSGIAGLNQPGHPARLDRSFNLVEPVGKVSGASRKPQTVQQPTVQQPVNLIRKLWRRDQLRLR